MQLSQSPARSLDLPRLPLLSLVRKFAPYLRRAATRDDPCAALERLARTSPHLLPDLGFEVDRAASGAGRTVWRRQGFVVTADPAAAPCDGSGVAVHRVPG
ncbi:MAG: hypothetical protein KDK28_21750 [Maritimibacter sp.]|nr:hypothetical protein [Maritimibacter sp.]